MAVFLLQESYQKLYDQLVKMKPHLSNKEIARTLGISPSTLRNMRDDKVKVSRDIHRSFFEFVEYQISPLPKSLLKLRHSYEHYAANDDNNEFKFFLNVFESLLLESKFLQPSHAYTLEVAGRLQLASWVFFDKAFRLKENSRDNAERAIEYYKKLLDVMKSLASSNPNLAIMQYCAELGGFAVRWNSYKAEITKEPFSSLTQSIKSDTLIEKAISIGESIEPNPSAIRNGLVAASITEDSRAENLLDLLILADPYFCSKNYRPSWANTTLQSDSDLKWLREQPYYSEKVK